MATTVITPFQTARPSLWNSYRHEMFKASRMLFYKTVILVPLVVGLALSALLVVIKALANPPKVNPNANPFSSYDLGSSGSFAFANQLVFSTLAPLYNLVIIVACTLVVANEYRWNTIKMLATRQPNRANLILSKTLFSLTLLFGVFFSTLVAWVIVGLVSKNFFELPFELTSTDFEAMGKGLAFYAISLLQTYILVLAAIVLTLWFKSIVGGIFFYFLYNGVDALGSNFGTNVANNGTNGAPDWLKPLLESLRAMNPILLNSNVNRVAMKEQVYTFTSGGKLINNPEIVLSTPLWWSWLVLAMYVVLFTGLAILVFARRDITD